MTTQGGSFIPGGMRRNNEWKEILEDNKEYFHNALECFNAAYIKEVTNFVMGTGQHKIISPSRLDEFSRACADDIYRYAVYHPLKDHRSVLESVRASYMIKWLMHFRPIILDLYASFSDDSKTLAYFTDAEREDAKEFYRKSNELFAIFLASYIIGIAPDDPNSPSLITNFMDVNIDGSHSVDSREVLDFIYTLRYRISHQDVYRPIFRRFESMARRLAT